MAASSPYSGNDYNAVSNFRPYEMPINDIARASIAIDEFWKAGARRVKAVYENALNLDLTLESNKEVKKKFMQEADKQLTKLSSMDLSDPSVQRQGFNIYRPLLTDEAIVYDDRLTKTLKSIYSEAERYKRSKLSSTGAEGEGYTQRNLAYSLDGFENFRADLPRDPALLKELYGKLGNRKYSPYYNASKEYTSILKNCKGSTTEKQDVASNYMYFDNYSKSGANSSETSNCFMMGLSEKAKEQMGIDGWAYYKANPELLVADHQQFAYGRQESQLKAIQGKIAGIKSGGITEEEKPLLKELEDMLPALKQEVDNRKNEYNEMVGGNAMNYVTQNFQTLAKGIYLNKNYAALGEAFKSDETSRKLTANAAGIAQFNALERANYQEREHQYNMEEITLRSALSRKLKQEAGEIPLDLVNPLTPPVTEGTDTGQSYKEQDFLKEKDLAFRSYSNAYQTLTSYILSQDPTLDKSRFTDAFILNWADQHSKKPQELQDKQFRELMEVYNQTKSEFSTLDMRQKAIEGVVNNEFIKDGKLQNIEIAGKTFTLSELARIRRGETIKGVNYVPRFTSMTTEGSFIGGDYYQLDGKGRYANNRYERTIEEINTRKDELYRKSYYDAKNYVSPRLDPNKNPAIDNQIRNILGVSGGSNEKNGYKLIGHDRTGKDLLVVPLDAEGNEMKADLKRARSLNVNVTEEKMGTSVNAIRIPNILRELPDVPTQQQQNDISNLRNFQTLMETQLRTKAGYFSSEDLKNADNTTYPYSNFNFKTPHGANIRVKAVQMNGQTKLVPAVQRTDGTWDTNFQSFSTPEELVLYFRIY